MANEPELNYLCRPTEPRNAPLPIDFLSVAEFLARRAGVQDAVGTRLDRSSAPGRSSWPSGPGCGSSPSTATDDGAADGFLLVNAPVNWQIDYVVVRPEARGQGIAAALVTETLNQAFLRGVPYVMLTSKASLRPLYEGCGFS